MIFYAANDQGCITKAVRSGIRGLGHILCMFARVSFKQMLLWVLKFDYLSVWVLYVYCLTL